MLARPRPRQRERGRFGHGCVRCGTSTRLHIRYRDAFKVEPDSSKARFTTRAAGPRIPRCCVCDGASPPLRSRGRQRTRTSTDAAPGVRPDTACPLANALNDLEMKNRTAVCPGAWCATDGTLRFSGVVPFRLVGPSSGTPRHAFGASRAVLHHGKGSSDARHVHSRPPQGDDRIDAHRVEGRNQGGREARNRKHDTRAHERHQVGGGHTKQL